MARLLLGVCGGIAAYRSLEFARLATKSGHGVRVLMTANAKRFVGADAFEAITGAPVLVSEFEPDPMRGGFPGEPEEDRLGHDPIGHLELAARADVFLVAPATANTIAKLAAGQADSLLTTAFLACEAPRIVAPAMNDRMWADAATAANVETLRSRGVTIVGPDEGELASRGEHGKGRMVQPEELLAAVEAAAGSVSGDPGGLAGTKVLVSAGGTREPLDDVRYIGNRSSGRMGLAVAGAARRQGAEVTVVCANVALPAPPGVERVDVVTAAEMQAALEERFAETDVLVMAAAVSDFTPADVTVGKIDREASGDLDLKLVPTSDIVASLAASRRDDQTIVGFAAEHGEGSVERAADKLRRKGLDLIAVNDISDPGIGFDSEQNEIAIVDAGGPEAAEHLDRTGKTELAEMLVERIIRQRKPT